MDFRDVFLNLPLWTALAAWALAQALKLPIERLRSGRWNWVVLLRAGGMPSSHSTLVAAAAHAIGLQAGFQSAEYALAVVVAIIVIYDATGIRRQAGRQAEVINRMIRDLLSGHPLEHRRLREVLGHSPIETLVGVLLGLVMAQGAWLLLGPG